MMLQCAGALEKGYNVGFSTSSPDSSRVSERRRRHFGQRSARGWEREKRIAVSAPEKLYPRGWMGVIDAREGQDTTKSPVFSIALPVSTDIHFHQSLLALPAQQGPRAQTSQLIEPRAKHEGTFHTYLSHSPAVALPRRRAVAPIGDDDEGHLRHASFDVMCPSPLLSVRRPSRDTVGNSHAVAFQRPDDQCLRGSCIAVISLFCFLGGDLEFDRCPGGVCGCRIMRRVMVNRSLFVAACSLPSLLSATLVLTSSSLLKVIRGRTGRIAVGIRPVARGTKEMCL